MTHLRGKYVRREISTSEEIENQIVDVADEQLNLENAELVHFGLNRLGLLEREVLTLYFRLRSFSSRLFQ